MLDLVIVLDMVLVMEFVMMMLLIPRSRHSLDLGLYVSFTGVVTFKRSDDLRSIAADVPLDRLLVETDAPYLAPVPYRGKANEPAYVTHTAACLAEVKGMSEDAFAEAVTENFFRLFTKVDRRQIVEAQAA